MSGTELETRLIRADIAPHLSFLALFFWDLWGGDVALVESLCFDPEMEFLHLFVEIEVMSENIETF